jgi:hypothetical protein
MSSENQSELELVKHAAVKAENGMILFGKCHADCFFQGRNTGIVMSSKSSDQGFITSYGRYVSREEAAKIAVNAKQVRPIIAVLMSEDLWFAELGGQFDYDYIQGYY